MYTKKYVRGGNARFDVFSKEKRQQDGLVYMKRRISYDSVVSRVNSSNCILEILQEGQKTQTARYLEAVVYNKKLLTNDERISELPFYDERYMRVFREAGDIDVEWVKKREAIDYGYRGEFSPLHLVDFIKGLKT